MSVETLIREIQKSRIKYQLFNPEGATEAIVAMTSRQFELAFAQPLPEAYRQLLRISDGVMENGLKIWPCAPHWKFTESVVSANREMRDSVSEDFLYFGQRDDSVFVLETSTGRWLAVELNGLAVWEEFSDCEAMFAFMLDSALGRC